MRKSMFLRIFLISFVFMAFLSAKGQGVAETNSGVDFKIVTTITLVVIALTLFAFVFVSISKSKERKKEDRAKEEEKQQKQAIQTDNAEIVAISMALHLYFDDRHEIEQTGFWLNRELNQYPAWAAKNILLKKLPIRRK